MRRTVEDRSTAAWPGLDKPVGGDFGVWSGARSSAGSGTSWVPQRTDPAVSGGAGLPEPDAGIGSLTLERRRDAVAAWWWIAANPSSACGCDEGSSSMPPAVAPASVTERRTATARLAVVEEAGRARCGTVGVARARAAPATTTPEWAPGKPARNKARGKPIG